MLSKSVQCLGMLTLKGRRSLNSCMTLGIVHQLAREIMSIPKVSTTSIQSVSETDQICPRQPFSSHKYSQNHDGSMALWLWHMRNDLFAAGNKSPEIKCQFRVTKFSDFIECRSISRWIHCGQLGCHRLYLDTMQSLAKVEAAKQKCCQPIPG